MDDLRGLLRTHQATVYNICFQVLRSSADAEDAAQETLLEAVRGVDRIREPRAFKRWICRVALHTALDHLRRRDRRARHEETRAAMNPPRPDPRLDAVHEALAKLEDDDRCLLVEKYFERATLEEIGAREGVTAAAVGKRIDRAKERLKQRLSQAGFAALVPGVDSILDSVRPATSAPSLNLEAALSGTTGVLSAKAVVLLALVLLVGAGGAYVWKRNSTKDRNLTSPSTASNRYELNGLGEITASEDAGGEVEIDSRPSLSELVTRLARFRKWYEEFNPPREEAGFSMDDPEESLKKVSAELAGVRDLIFKNPRVFLEWIALPENARCVVDLLAATLCEMPKSQEGAVLAGVEPEPVLQRFGEFPPELTDGLLRLLHGDNAMVREAILKFALTLKDAPPEWRTRYQELISVDDVDHRALAIRTLLFTGEPSSREFQSLVGLMATLGYDPTYPLLQELCRVESPEARNQVLIGLETGRITDPVGQMIYYVVSWVFSFHPQPGDGFEERASRLLISALPRARREHDCSELVYAALHLQPRFAKPIVLKATTDGPTDQLRRAAAAVLEKAGMEEENWRIHGRLWMELMGKN